MENASEKPQSAGSQAAFTLFYNKKTVSLLFHFILFVYFVDKAEILLYNYFYEKENDSCSVGFCGFGAAYRALLYDGNLQKNGIYI